MSESEEEARARSSRERAERGESDYFDIVAGPKPKIYTIGKRPERPEPVDFTALAKCSESCEDLKEDLGTMTGFEIAEWRNTVTQTRDAAAERKDFADWSAYQREVGCTTKWIEQCETELSDCNKDCPELKEEFQSGTTNVLSKKMRDAIEVQAVNKLDDQTIPRTEVVDAQQQLQCLFKYEDCVGKKKG